MGQVDLIYQQTSSQEPSWVDEVKRGSSEYLLTNARLNIRAFSLKRASLTKIHQNIQFVQQSEETSTLTVKQKAGDAANRWLERNRNLVLRQTPVWAQTMAGLLVALGTITVAAGFLFRIDEVVSVQGQLASIGGTVEVKTPAGGRVAEVLYKDGEIVDQGQLLVRFDTRQAASEKATYINLIALENKELESRLKIYESQVETLKGRADVLDQKLKTKVNIVSELKSLVDQGGFQKIQYLEQLDQVFELKKQLNEIEQQLGQIQLSAEQTRLSARKSVDQMRSKLQALELQLQYKNVSAPTKGIVFDPQASAEGVLQPGERILSIVPQKGLYAQVFVPNKDIGFVKTGQKVKVRVDAFPFTRYGELSGQVSQIGADSLPPDSEQNFYRFPVKVKLDSDRLENKGTEIYLQSGMAITANLKLRDKRVISLISDMLVDQTDSVKSLRQ